MRCEPLLSGVAFANFARGDPYQRYESNGDEDDGGPALELLHFSVEQSEADEDEEEVRAEDLQRGFAEGEERLAGDEFDDVSAQEIKDNGETDEVDDAEPADLPLVEFEAECLRRQVRAEPTEADSDEEEADREADTADPARNFSERECAVCESGAEPEAYGPHSLPSE